MPSTRSGSTKDPPTLAVHTSALAPRSTTRRAQSAQPGNASTSSRSTRNTRASSLFPSQAKLPDSPSPGPTDTPTSTGPPSDVDEDLDLSTKKGELEEEAELIDTEPEQVDIKQEAREEGWEMLHSAGAERSGLRGRNVEDTSHFEEEGLLRRVDSDLSEKDSRKGPGKSKEKEARVERVLDYGGSEADEGLNNPRDRNAFALLILLCKPAKMVIMRALADG